MWQTPLFECGPKCSCNKKVCRLQITHESLGVDVEVRWHPDKQFCVHCKADIPMGAYVATYVGEVGRSVSSGDQPVSALPPTPLSARAGRVSCES